MEKIGGILEGGGGEGDMEDEEPQQRGKVHRRMKTRVQKVVDEKAQRRMWENRQGRQIQFEKRERQDRKEIERAEGRERRKVLREVGEERKSTRKRVGRGLRKSTR